MKLLKLIVSLVAIACIAGSCNTTKDSQTKNSKKMEFANKEKVVALLNSFNTGNQTPISYINPNTYIQHNLAVADGLEGFGEVIHTLLHKGSKPMLFVLLKMAIMYLLIRNMIFLGQKQVLIFSALRMEK